MRKTPSSRCTDVSLLDDEIRGHFQIVKTQVHYAGQYVIESLSSWHAYFIMAGITAVR